jgi:acylpyruvate hydrolase
MKLVTLDRVGQKVVGVWVGNEILDIEAGAAHLPFARGLPHSVRGMLDAGDVALDQLRRITGMLGEAQAGLLEALRECGALVQAHEAKLLAPISDPGFILAAGLNYREHLREMNTPVPTEPASFYKSVTAVIGPGEAIVLPRACPDMVDWEGEFSAVIGQPCHNVSASNALDYVAGYTLINDVSARDWVSSVFSSTGVMGPIHAWEKNILGKQFPTFCPMGPALATRDEFPDPNQVQITTTLNGKVMQAASTSDLVFDVSRLIAYYSRFYRFQPGDIVTTGSPSGVGYGRNPKVFMRPGDIIAVTVDRIGTLSNPVEAPGP